MEIGFLKLTRQAVTSDRQLSDSFPSYKILLKRRHQSSLPPIQIQWLRKLLAGTRALLRMVTAAITGCKGHHWRKDTMGHRGSKPWSRQRKEKAKESKRQSWMVHGESRLEGILLPALAVVPTLLGASGRVRSQDNEPTPDRRFSGNSKAAFPVISWSLQRLSQVSRPMHCRAEQTCKVSDCLCVCYVSTW